MRFDYTQLERDEWKLLQEFRMVAYHSCPGPEYEPSGYHSFKIKESQIGQEGILCLLKRFGPPDNRIEGGPDGLWYAFIYDGWDDGGFESEFPNAVLPDEVFTFYFKSELDAIEARLMF